MENPPEKHIESLNKAISNIRVADHMIYITYPVIKDKRLLIKTLEHINDSVVCTINSILQHDSAFKRITLYSNSRDNLEIFMSKCCQRYNITPEEKESIKELFYIVESHKKSPMEFSRREKIIIMSDSLKTSVIDSEKLKKYLSLAKNMINKAKFGFSMQ